MVSMTLQRLATTFFKPAARYPADPRAVFILVLSVFSSLTTLLLMEGPPSLEGLLPQWAVLGWALLLGAGSILTLVGMMFQSVNGIVTEQVGSVTVMAATVFYSGIAFYQIGPAAIQAVGIILAWGLSCGLRWIQLQSLINDAVGRAHKRAVLDRIEAEIAARRKGEVDKERFRVDKHDSLGQWDETQ